jgi:molybdenum cofactor cytidylyltransferase
MKRIGAIVLAAGGASRMGQPKQLLAFQGKTLVRRAAESALQGGCEPVVVVTGAATQSVTDAVKDLPVHPRFNSQWSTGMGSSITAGIRSLLMLDPHIEAAIILPCDQARIDSGVISVLIERFVAAGKPIAACVYSGTIGTPCCFDQSMFAQLQSLNGDSGAKSLLRRHVDQVSTFDWPQGAFDVDTPDDWQLLCQDDPNR